MGVSGGIAGGATADCLAGLHHLRSTSGQSPAKPGQLLGTHAAVIAGDHQFVDESGSDEPQLAPAPPRSDGGLSHGDDPPVMPQAGRKLVVLHDGQIRKSAQFLKQRPSKEDSLVTVGLLEPMRAEVGGPLHKIAVALPAAQPLPSRP